MITTDLIVWGYENHIVNMIYEQKGVSAEIGDHKICLSDDEQETPVIEPIEQIVSKIFNKLNTEQEEGRDSCYDYCESVLRNAMTSIWRKIHCTELDPDNHFWTVEAWNRDVKAEDENDSEVIAYIDDITSRIIYVNKSAKEDPYAQCVIQHKIGQLPPITIEKTYGYLEITIKTYHDKNFDVEISLPGCPDNPGKDAVFVGLSDQDNFLCLDLAGVKVGCERADIYVWDDVFDEDWTRHFKVKHEEMEAVRKEIMKEMRSEEEALQEALEQK